MTQATQQDPAPAARSGRSFAVLALVVVCAAAAALGYFFEADRGAQLVGHVAPPPPPAAAVQPTQTQPAPAAAKPPPAQQAQARPADAQQMQAPLCLKLSRPLLSRLPQASMSYASTKTVPW